MIEAKPIPTTPTHGGVCFCCRRRDDGVGFIVTGKPPKILWSCRDHIHLAEKAHRMPRRELDLHEQDALKEAGDAGGAYLDGIGKSDLAHLDGVQWVSFLRTVLNTFGEALAKRLESDEAPF